MEGQPRPRTSSDTKARIRRWFWRPPRPHGETLADRRVSALELLYDLVYVAVIGQAAHHLAIEVTLATVVDFAIVFALIWIAWVNGSLYVELHGQQDGRTRSIVFIQMGILALLAVFAADATGQDAAAFAVVYTVYLAFTAWLWYAVRERDRIDHPEFLAPTGRYVLTTVTITAATLASAFLAPEPRLLVWVTSIGGWCVLIVYQGRGEVGLQGALTPTNSLVERFGLFTIIVLGEVVFGVVDGLSAASRDLTTIATGMIALGLGFGFWWIYFDVIGGRFPNADGRSLARWMLGHLPITLAIAAGGAAMVSLIAHANDASTPAATAWLLSGTVALELLAASVVSHALADAERLADVFGPLRWAMVFGAVGALVVGWLQPAPWLLALLLGGILSILWFFALGRFLRADAWLEAIEPVDA